MTRILTTNYLADSDTQFQWATDSNDGFSRELDVSFLARALERHTHASGRGLQIAAGGIAPNAVTATEIAALAVGNSELADDAVNARVIAAGAVGASELAAGAALANLAAQSITNSYLAVGAAAANLAATPTIDKNTGAVDANLYTRTGLMMHTTDGSRPAISFMRDGTGAAAIYYEGGNEFRNIQASGLSAKFWTDLNDGSGSGMDADTVDGNHASAFATAGHTHPPGDATTLDGIDSTGFALAGHTHSNVDATTLGGFSAANYLRASAVNGGWNNTSINFNGGQGLTINGNFTVGGGGTKNRLATGSDGSEGLFHSFETPLPMFMEVGRSAMRDGYVVVEIPQDFANYVDLSEYHVILQPETDTVLYVEERTPTGFVVRSRSQGQVPFSWMVIARQGDLLHVTRQLPLKDAA